MYMYVNTKTRTNTRHYGRTKAKKGVHFCPTGWGTWVETTSVDVLIFFYSKE